MISAVCVMISPAMFVACSLNVSFLLLRNSMLVVCDKPTIRISKIVLLLDTLRYSMIGKTDLVHYYQ